MMAGIYMEIETRKNYILALLNKMQHPECGIKDIHMAVINLETERVIKSVYTTEFTLNRS